jgi:hypothetical protein
MVKGRGLDSGSQEGCEYDNDSFGFHKTQRIS